MDAASMRRAIIERHGLYCDDCGKEFTVEQLRLHHEKEGRGYNNPERFKDLKLWLNDPRGLRIICEDCHRKRHKVRNRAFPDDYKSIFDEDTDA